MVGDPPAGYNTITAYAVVEDADRLIQFVQQAFGAEVLQRVADNDGRVTHAEVRIGDSRLMLGTASVQTPPFPAMLHVYLNDVDAAYASALAAGARPLREPADQYYGDRMAGVVDPLGNQWWLAKRIEDLPPEEIERRAAALTQEG